MKRRVVSEVRVFTGCMSLTLQAKLCVSGSEIDFEVCGGFLFCFCFVCLFVVVGGGGGGVCVCVCVYVCVCLSLIHI